MTKRSSVQAARMERKSAGGFTDPRCRYESTIEVPSKQGVIAVITVSSLSQESVVRYIKEATEIKLVVKQLGKAELDRNVAQEEPLPDSMALEPGESDRRIDVRFIWPSKEGQPYLIYRLSVGPSISLASTDTYTFDNAGTVSFSATAKVTSGTSNLTLNVSSGGSSLSGTGKKVTRKINQGGATGTDRVSGSSISYQLSSEGNIVSDTL